MPMACGKKEDRPKYFYIVSYEKKSFIIRYDKYKSYNDVFLVFETFDDAMSAMDVISNSLKSKGMFDISERVVHDENTINGEPLRMVEVFTVTETDGGKTICEVETNNIFEYETE